MLKCINEQMRKAWKGHKYKLHSYFKDIGGLEDVELAKRKPHPDLNEEQQADWEKLCEIWTSEKFQVVVQFKFLISIYIFNLLLIILSTFLIRNGRQKTLRLDLKGSGSRGMDLCLLRVITFDGESR